MILEFLLLTPFQDFRIKSQNSRIKSQNSRIRSQGASSGQPKRPRSSWAQSGASPMRPGSAPGSPREAQNVSLRKKDAFLKCPRASGSAPRQLILTPIRRQEHKNRVLFTRLGRAGPSEQLFNDFCRFSFFSQNANSLFRTTPANKNKGLALRAAS